MNWKLTFILLATNETNHAIAKSTTNSPISTGSMPASWFQINERSFSIKFEVLDAVGGDVWDSCERLIGDVGRVVFNRDWRMTDWVDGVRVEAVCWLLVSEKSNGESSTKSTNESSIGESSIIFKFAIYSAQIQNHNLSINDFFLSKWRNQALRQFEGTF